MVEVRGPRPHLETVCIKGVNVEQVQAYRYLEVQLDEKLNSQNKQRSRFMGCCTYRLRS